MDKIIIAGILNDEVFKKRFMQTRVVLDPEGICTTLSTMAGGITTEDNSI